jgi:hypothetical protein
MWPGIFIGIGLATALIVAAEIKFKYSLGDKVADVFRSGEKKIAAAEAWVIKTKAKIEAMKVGR